MKFWMSLLTMTALLAFAAGCPKESEPGGTGVTGGEEKESSDTYTLTMPDGQNVTQGEQVEETIGIDRGSDYKDVVKVTLTAPAGITVTPTEFSLEGDATEQTIVIAADSTAKVGDHMIKVTGTATGDPVNDDFVVTVEEASDDNVDDVDNTDNLDNSDPVDNIDPADQPAPPTIP